MESKPNDYEGPWHQHYLNKQALIILQRNEAIASYVQSKPITREAKR